jgi:choline dehydrogenase-like flavoprotein
VGNRQGLVGRFFQDHPTATFATVDPDRYRILEQRFSAMRRSRIWYFAKIPLSEQQQTAHQVLNCTVQVAFDFGPDSGEEALLRILSSVRQRSWPAELPRELRRVAGHPREMAGLVERYLRGRPWPVRPEGIRLVSLSEQAPNPDSRVTLSEEKDALGLRRARLDWRLTHLDRRTIATMAETIAEEFRRLRITPAKTSDWLEPADDAWTSQVQASFHHSGTTRMASVPSEGVVDETCAVHGTPNLFVCGGSVFPTSGTANPTLTIVALAIRLADHLRGRPRGV